MDTYDCIATKLDVNEFARKRVPGEIKAKVLEAARLTGSSRNRQHWRFLLIQDRGNLATLALDSTTGQWVRDADFAIVIMIDPAVPGSMIDAGRVLQDMQLAAWNFGVASRLYTGLKEEELKRDFGLPQGLKAAVALGFGYPVRKIRGKKDRKPLEELVSLERYGTRIGPGDLS
ncbi:MAG: nitroreductase family protein [Nitrososphaerota archaeon]|nr:nitroreductase family protein [Nitrososphaerota archaeon]MDG6939617.1 nitroreductase family protein [Nitrososphaerota archaeon]